MNYRLVAEGNYVRLEMKNGPLMDYFTPNRDLLEILHDGPYTISLFDNNGRMKVGYWLGAWRRHDRKYVYLCDLIYGCYHGAVHAKTLEGDLQRYLEWKRLQGLTIDHLDGNIHNNSIWNLSLMPLSSNVSKRSFPAGFVGQYALSMAYVGEEYRLQLVLENTERDVLQGLLDSALPGQFTLGDDAGISALHLVCPDAEDLVECLRYLYDTRLNWCNPGETARVYKRAHRDTEHLAADIKRSLSAQRVLAEMDRSQFQLFTAEKEIPIPVSRAI